MKFIWIFYIFLINQVLLQNNYDLGKDQKLTTDSAVIFFDELNLMMINLHLIDNFFLLFVVMKIL